MKFAEYDIGLGGVYTHSGNTQYVKFVVYSPDPVPHPGGDGTTGPYAWGSRYSSMLNIMPENDSWDGGNVYIFKNRECPCPTPYDDVMTHTPDFKIGSYMGTYFTAAANARGKYFEAILNVGDILRFYCGDGYFLDNKGGVTFDVYVKDVE